MAIDVNLRDIQTGFLTATAYTENNTLIEAALQEAVSREGGANNEMLADLDMGLHWVNNLNPAVSHRQAVTLGQMQDFITGSADNVTSTTSVEFFTATGSQTVFTFESIEYFPGINALIVFKDGVYQRVAEDYLETDSTSITLTEPVPLGTEITVLGARFSSEVFLTEATSAAATATDAADAAEQSAIDAEASNQEAQDAAGYKLAINNQGGVTYTLILSDAGDLVRMSNATSNTVVIPTNAAVPFEIGSIVGVRQTGEGITSVTGDTGVTVNAPYDDFSTAGSDLGLGLVKVAIDEWDVVKSYSGISEEDLSLIFTPAGNNTNGALLLGNVKINYGRIPDTAWSGTRYLPFTLTYSVPPSVSITSDTNASYIGQSSQQQSGLMVQNLDTAGVTVRNLRLGDDTSGDVTAVSGYYFAIGV